LITVLANSDAHGHRIEVAEGSSVAPGDPDPAVYCVLGDPPNEIAVLCYVSPEGEVWDGSGDTGLRL